MIRRLLPSGLVLLFLASLCFFGPYFLSHRWDEMTLEFGVAAPSWEHWFGVDELGRDHFARVLEGGRVSLMVGIVTSLVAGIVGVAVGTLAGYFGGFLDHALMRLVDLLYTLPSYFVVLLVMVFFKVESIFVLFFVLGFFQWLGMARIVRAQVLSLKEREFVLAAQAAGANAWRITWKHLWPGCLGIILVYITMTVPGVMMQEAFLSFIGISFMAPGSEGVPTPVASWGTLVSEGLRTAHTAPWLLVFPSVFLSLTLLSIHFLGDALRDAFDPRQKAS